MVRFLLDAGAETDRPDWQGNTALARASWYGCKDIVQLLLEAGVNTNLKNHAGQTALSHAAEKGHEDVVQLLLKAGADEGAEQRDSRFDKS